MKSLNLIVAVIAISSLGVLVSCKKYSEGGTLKKAEKNIIQTWKLDSYYFNGVDKTSTLLITNFKETYAEDGTYTRTYTDSSGDPITQLGSWSLESNNALIKVSGAGSFELSVETSSVSASEYTILKLTQEELWYEFMNGSDMHEFHLVPN